MSHTDKPKVYGLMVPKKPGQATRARPPPPAPKRAPGSAFSLDDDDSDGAEDDPMASKQAFNAMLKARSDRARQQAEAAAKAALAEDPSIYDYDGVYDEMQAERGERAAREAAAAKEERQQSKYIDSLKRAAELKKREQDRYFERRLAKERKEEDEQYKDKEVFVTSAYKKKLLEMKKWDAIDKMEEEAERKAAEGRTNMDGFFSNLLSNNIALGADVKKAARSAYTVGSATQERVLTAGGLPSSSEAEAAKEGGRTGRAEREAEAPPAGPSSRMVDSGGGGAGKRPRPGEAEGAEKRPRAAEGEEEGQQDGGEKAKPAAAAAAKAPASAPAPAAAPAPAVDPEEAKRRKEEAIRKARERFLARKQQNPPPAGAEA